MQEKLVTEQIKHKEQEAELQMLREQHTLLKKLIEQQKQVSNINFVYTTFLILHVYMHYTPI